MPRLSGFFAWIWLLMVLNTMVQPCFVQENKVASDPVNSLSEMLMESWLALEDHLPSDEQATEERELKTANVLHWQCVSSMLQLKSPSALASRQVWEEVASVCLNFSGEVLLPPPDGLLLA